MIKEKKTFDCGPYSANALHFDKSGVNIAVAGDDGLIRLYNE